MKSPIRFMFKCVSKNKYTETENVPDSLVALNVCQVGFVCGAYLNVFLLMQCGEPFKEENMVVINGTKAEVEKLKQKMLERRDKSKSKASLTSHPSVVECLCWGTFQLWLFKKMKHNFCFRSQRRARRLKQCLRQNQKVCAKPGWQLNCIF